MKIFISKSVLGSANEALSMNYTSNEEILIAREGLLDRLKSTNAMFTFGKYEDILKKDGFISVELESLLPVVKSNFNISSIESSIEQYNKEAVIKKIAKGTYRNCDSTISIKSYLESTYMTIQHICERRLYVVEPTDVLSRQLCTFAVIFIILGNSLVPFKVLKDFCSNILDDKSCSFCEETKMLASIVRKALVKIEEYCYSIFKYSGNKGIFTDGVSSRYILNEVLKDGNITNVILTWDKVKCRCMI